MLETFTMRTTTDTFTGKPFRYNYVLFVDGVQTVGRITRRTNVWLHPTRLPEKLHGSLNPATA